MLSSINRHSRLVMLLSGMTLSFIYSCHPVFSNKEELIHYLYNPKNGLSKTIQTGEIKATLVYRPWSLLSNQGGADKSYLTDKYHFVLSLSVDNKALLRQLNYSRYSQIIQVMTFQMGDYVTGVLDNEKRVEVAFCNYQPTYGMSNADDLLIVFKKVEFKKIVIQIREFGLNTGDMNFEFDNDDIATLTDINL